MKKQFITLVALVLGVLSSTNVVRGQEINLDDIKNPENWFYTTLVAQPSTESAAAGTVNLTLLDMTGDTIDSNYRLQGYELTGVLRPINSDMVTYEEDGNTKITGYTDYKSSVQLTGYALIYMPGVETTLSGTPLSTYAYFKGDAKANDGWYLAGWSYTDGAYDLGKEPTFKVLPSKTAGAENKTTNYAFATFKPVLVTDYKVNGLINGTNGTTTVEFDVLGEDVDYNDFTVSVSGAGFSELVEASCVDNKVTVTVTYTGTTNGEFAGSVTLTSKSGKSALTATVYARVGEDAATTEATLYDKKNTEDNKQSGSLADMINAEAICGYAEPIIALNKNYETALTTTSTFTLDLNGYNLNGLEVSGGELTLAYSKYGGNINNTVAVNSGKLILNGATITAAKGVTVAESATLEQNGATINATSIAIENNGTTIINEGVMVGTSTAGVKSNNGRLTINGGAISGNYALWVESGTANVTKGTLTGTNYGIYSQGTTTTEKLATIYGGTNAVYVAKGTMTLNNGKFDGATPLTKQSEGTLNINAGYFKTDTIGVKLPTGKKLFNVSAGVEYNAGYRYFVGDDASAQLSGVGVCKIGTTAYATLEDALAYANNNSTEEVVIIMLNDYVLPAGYYTLPAKATLVVPMSDTQETAYPTVNRVSRGDYVEPDEFRRLTFASGVNMNVFGTIELSGTQRANNDAYASMPHGAYGHLVMSEGAKMTLQNGSELRAWGYVTGKGETDARRGSTVREQFQMADWKGGTESLEMLSSDKGVFPITQYFIQNIESPVKYHPGAVLSTTASVSVTASDMSLTAMANDIKIIGVNEEHEAMFLMDNEADQENTWVRKWYNAADDQQTYEVNSGAHIGSMVLDLGYLGTMPLVMNSGVFVLPITNNMKIHLLSGYMDFTQSTSLLPGAEVEINKESIVTITRTEGIRSGSVYIYSADDWAAFDGTNYTKLVKYSASLDKQPTVRTQTTKPADAAINVHGTFDTNNGYVYTTTKGANIFSTNADAGTFTFTAAAQPDTYNEKLYQYCKTTEGKYTYCNMYSALLKNGDDIDPAYATTANTAAGMSYCYMDDKWTLLTVSDVNPCFMVDNYDTYYAKPAEYVAIIAQEKDGEIVGNDDHTFSDKAGKGRLFILTGNCQWWEVEKKDNLYHCVHPENDTYYYWGWDTSKMQEGWLEKRYTVTWKNWNGALVDTPYDVPYGTMAEYLGTNPTREADIDYTYDFAGWTPELGKVTSDVTYTAKYKKKERKYTIIFQTEGGVEIERQFLTHNQVPVCENMPTKVGHYLEWQPAIAAVTGDATYTATWLEEKPTEYTITFVDYDGRPLQSGEVLANTKPTEPADPTGKPATDEYTYVFDRWSPTLAVATENMTYTAVYEEVEKTYMISYYKENGTTLISTEELTYGATPTPPAVTKENPEEGYVYTLVWKTLDVSSTIQTVTGNASYKPTYTAEINIMPELLALGEGDNSEIINAGGTVDIKVNRNFVANTLYTLSLPFAMNNVVEIFGAGTILYKYSSLTMVGGELEIGFDKVNSIEAGTPYLIEPAQAVDGFTAEDVTITNTQTPITFTADGNTLTMKPVLTATTGAKTNGEYWLASDRYLYNAQTNLLSLRAVFELNVPEASPVPRARVVFNQNTATGVDQVQGNEVPTKMIINGQLFILRGEKMYDAQGKLVK